MMRFRIGCILVLGLLTTVRPDFAQQEPPKELLQYIRDARKAGLKDEQIQQNARQAGWSTSAVADAIRSLGNTATAVAAPAPREADRNHSAAPAPPAEAPAGGAKPAETPASKSSEAGLLPPKIADRGAPDDYVIGEGDVLHISVWREPDASVTGAVVRTDGKISMPMLKEVQVAGMTPVQAEQAITERLTKFISAADVTVVVSAIHSKKIYVVGGVKKEGPIPYTYRMTVMQALSEAGGLTDYAKRKKIYVLHYENGREYRFPFNYDAAVRGEGMELNRVLVPGDTLVIPK
jgi:polysaccharide export outer membrane protein